MSRSIDWSLLKNLIDRGFDFQYSETENEYHISSSDGIFQFDCFVAITNPRNSQQIDFEDNYKDLGNITPAQKVSMFGKHMTGIMFAYITHYVSESGTTTYVGKMKFDGTWLIQEIEESGVNVTIQFANISNNPSKADLDSAWADRVNLVYANLNTLENF